MPRSTRKKSKTGFYHVMLRVNTEPSPVHWSTRKKSKTGFYHVMLRVNTEPSPVHLHFQGEYAVRQMEINGIMWKGCHWITL